MIHISFIHHPGAFPYFVLKESHKTWDWDSSSWNRSLSIPKYSTIYTPNLVFDKAREAFESVEGGFFLVIWDHDPYRFGIAHSHNNCFGEYGGSAFMKKGFCNFTYEFLSRVVPEKFL